MSAKVQMLARWSDISFKRNITDPNEAELRRIISGDEPSDNGIIQGEIVHKHGPVVFDLADVKRYNRASERGYTTVHFNDGDTLVLKIPFLDYLEIDIQYSGKNINDFIPVDYVDPEDEEMDKETDTDLEL